MWLWLSQLHAFPRANRRSVFRVECTHGGHWEVASLFLHPSRIDRLEVPHGGRPFEHAGQLCPPAGLDPPGRVSLVRLLGVPMFYEYDGATIIGIHVRCYALAAVIRTSIGKVLLQQA